MIWIIAVVLLALMGWIGYQQGALRGVISFIGMLIAAASAMALGPFLRPLLSALGVQHPALHKIIGPIVAFLIIYIIFQVIAFTVEQKFEIFYKYKKSQKEQFKMERMNSRVGICLGLLQGVTFFILAMIPVYLFGYLTVQIAEGAQDNKTIQLLTKARQELQSTKFDRVVAAYDPANEALYDAFDVVGLVYNNPVLESRLSKYPSFLTLAELPEFQELGNDVEFHNLWQGGATVNQLLEHPKVQAISTNTALIATIQEILVKDLKDLKNYLLTGESETYGHERILGRWEFDLLDTVNTERRSRSSINANELRVLRASLTPYLGATLVATTENKLILKRGENAPGSEGQPRVMAEGTWERSSGLYKVSIENRTVDVIIEDGKKLILPWGKLKLIFKREI